MGDTVAGARPGRGPLAAFVAALRPKQWVKNGFVFGPLLFSRNLGHWTTDLEACLMFAAFCAASSAVYLMNDVLDYEADRLHPVKRRRPVAAGELGRPAALIASVLLGLAGIAGAIATGLVPGAPGTAAGAFSRGLVPAALVAAYILLNVSYSLGLKQVVIVDVMMIGAGFVLRVLGGTAAIHVSPSHWLVLCTILLSVFLGFTKRRGELATLEEKAADHRKVLDSYSAAFLDQMISVVTAATLMCYILYTVDQRTVESVAGGSRGLLLTVPFVMYGIFRYLYIVYRREEGENPTTALLGDRMLLAGIVLWAVLAAAVVYYPQFFRGWFAGATGAAP